ncbi:MAG: hypothetical protein IPH33_19410 [Bacteroidetes bacterium]|nr:hypothetical protein [Bacteroidota bacterium]
MSNNQKDVTSPTKTDANQNKNGQNDTMNKKKEDGSSKSSETTEKNEKVKPVINDGDQEREETEHPHKSDEPVAEKAEKSNK